MYSEITAVFSVILRKKNQQIYLLDFCRPVQLALGERPNFSQKLVRRYYFLGKI